MKFAVLALISMYLIVQTYGKLMVTPYPSNSMYYNPMYRTRKTMEHSHQTQYKHVPTLTSDGNKMVLPLPLPIRPLPTGGVSGTSYDIPAPAFLENLPNIRDGLYFLTYGTSDGTAWSEYSEMKMDQDKNEYIAIVGEYIYTDSYGVTHEVTYTADENGFKQNDKILKNQEYSNRI